jgi:hypothetical protein
MPVTVEVRAVLPMRQAVPLLDDGFAWLRRVDALFSADTCTVRMAG